MSQNSFVLDGNIDAVPYGNNLQSAFQALATNNSGPTEPTTTYAFMTWYDTATGLIKQRDASNTTWIVKGQITGSSVIASTNNFRLSPVTGDPVGTTVATSNLFFTPYTGNTIALYDSTNFTWKLYTLSEQVIPLVCAVGSVTDIFAFDNGSGSVTFEQLPWTSVTTRAVALTRQNGVLVKSGAPSRRYIGSYAAQGANSTRVDELRMFLFNADNQIPRTLRVLDTTGTGQTHSAAVPTRTFKGVANTYNFIVLAGLTGNLLDLEGSCISVSTAGTIYYLGIGLNSTTTAATNCISRGAGAVNFATSTTSLKTRAMPLGLNTLTLLETCPAPTVTTSSLTVMGSSFTTGMWGTYLC
jgi:hypothetical protein